MIPPIRCIAFGRRIATDIALPGAVADDGGSPPEVVIRRWPPAPRQDTDHTLWREGAALHFAPPGVAAYRCTATTIDVTPCPGADEDAIAALLIATALPGLAWLDGGFVLHASAAVLPGGDGAVAIAAASGEGKSTLLARLVACGARVVADDSLCLRRIGAGLTASGLPGGWFAHHPDPAARPFVAVDPAHAVLAAPLRAVLLLHRHPAPEPASLRRLAPLPALAAILSHRHRPAIPALFGEPGRRLDDAAAVARVPVYRWSRPEGELALTAPEWEAILPLGESR